MKPGKVSPSVDLLTEIAYQLGLPVTEFVRDKTRVMIHLKAEELPQEDNSSRSRRCLFPENTVAEGLAVWINNLEAGGIIEQSSNKRYEGAQCSGRPGPR